MKQFPSRDSFESNEIILKDWYETFQIGLTKYLQSDSALLRFLEQKKMIDPSGQQIVEWRRNLVIYFSDVGDIIGESRFSEDGIKLMNHILMPSNVDFDITCIYCLRRFSSRKNLSDHYSESCTEEI